MYRDTSGLLAYAVKMSSASPDTGRRAIRRGVSNVVGSMDILLGSNEERTATINRIRGLMSEFGIVLPQKADTVRRGAHLELEHLPGWARRSVADLLVHVTLLDERIGEYDTHLKQVAKEDERSKRLMQMPGIGPTTATALLASIGNDMTSGMAGSWQHGWAWCRDSTAPAARSSWAKLPRRETGIYARC